MKILIKNLDGSVGIMTPVLECGLTINEIIAKDIPKGAVYEVVEDSVVPTDREFRDAWKHDLTVDIPKAQEITKNKLRAERAPLLADLDIQFMKALEAQSDASTILAEKQRLRDITKVVDTLTTVDELKAVTV